MIPSKYALAGLLALTLTHAQAALAEENHLHAGDIEIEIDNGQLVAHGAAHSQFGTGYGIFEADFGDLAGGPYKTDDPGYDSVEGTFLDGDIINYQALGNLWFWDGATWSNSVSNGESVQLDGNFGETTIWTTAGVTGDAIGLIGQAGFDGKIHEHLDMRVKAPTGFLPTAGAYYVTLQLTSASYDSSNPYLMVFNNGLDETAYENAVHALAVPEADTYAMLLAGLGLISLALRRR